MNQNKNLFTFKLISPDKSFKDDKEYWQTIDNLSPYSRTLLFAMYCYSFRYSREKKNNDLMAHGLYCLKNNEKNINTTFFLDNVKKSTPLLREWANELVDKKFIEIREE